MKNIYIDAEEFSDFKSFLAHMTTKFMSDNNSPLTNLDALEDVLEGGGGIFEENTPITVKWSGFRKSMEDLGYEETIMYYKKMLKTCHPSNREEVSLMLKCAKENIGQTLFFLILEVFLESENISMELF